MTLNKSFWNVNKTFLCIVFVILLYDIFYWLSGEAIYFYGDFHLRWQENAYLLNGINPFDAMQGKVVIDSIGPLFPQAGTVPWTFVLGNVLSPGFLPYSIALPYGIAVFAVLFLIAAKELYSYLVRHNYLSDDKYLYIILACSIVLPSVWRNTFFFGNNAGIVFLLAVIVLCNLDRHPILSGALLGLMTIKPQLSGVIFILLILKRKWTPLLIACGITIAAWITSFIATQTEPFEMALAMLSLGSGLPSELGAYMGLFDPLRFLDVSTVLILLLSLLSGIIFFVIFWFLAKKKGLDNDLLILFSGAAIASSFWFYKQPHDLIILAIPGIAVFLTFLNSEKCRYSVVLMTAWTAIASLLLYTNPFKTIVSRVVSGLAKTPIEPTTSICQSIEKLLVMAVGISLLYLFAFVFDKARRPAPQISK